MQGEVSLGFRGATALGAFTEGWVSTRIGSGLRAALATLWTLHQAPASRRNGCISQRLV